MTSLLILLLTAIFSFAIGFVAIPHIVDVAKEYHIFDQPNARKVHTLPIPRLGGTIFLPAVLTSICIVLVVLLRIKYPIECLWNEVAIQHFLAYAAGSMILFAIGFFDDLHGIGYKAKFAVQIIAALLLCTSGLWIANLEHIFWIDAIGWYVGMPLTILFVVYVTNAMNLIDGLDGLASGLSSISLFIITTMNYLSGHIVWAMVSIAFLGVVLAFFYYNVFDRKNRIFMGDAGSLTMGFTLAFLTLHFWQDHPVWNPYFHNSCIVVVSTLTIPLLDVVRVFFSRVRDGRNPFLPDKNHIHHKLLRTGMGPKFTMLSILLMSALIIVVNYLMALYISQTIMLITDIILFVLMHLTINIFIYRKEHRDGIKWERAY